ncbi:putative bifunctional diguanylate cyclase/phosphodiesterase [Shewanella marina]|uniref:putative bifunctional diguanylate cyclase/phosphodiesterase n=1 Tax=Shewanella marina TaxID=487319 RepID=UPI00047149DB|nr:GGDEF domain-containing phosphodiesterase [Shewanella marina]
MSPSKSRLWFVSLKWKLLLSVLFMLMLVGIMLGLFAYKQLLTQQHFILQNQKNKFEQNLHTTVTQVVDQSTTSAQQFTLLLNQIPAEQTEQEFQQSFAQYWSDMRLFWGLTSLTLFNTDYHTLAAVGKDADENTFNWINGLKYIDRPQWRFVCEVQCNLQVLVPTLFRGKMHLLLMGSDLTEMLTRFRMNGEYELAVLGPEFTNGKQGFWGHDLYSLSNREVGISLLDHAEQKWDWQQIIKSNRTYELDGKTLTLWSFKLDEKAISSPMLLVFSDVTEWQSIINRFQVNLIGTLLFALVLASGLVLVFAWLPVNRLGQHAKLLPLLAEHRFDELRDAFPKQDNMVVDEIDLINDATLSLTDKLQDLEEEVEGYTAELRRQAMMDSLTGLPNKSMLLHELNKAIACVGRTHNEIALLFLDLDDFKRINDTLGHSEGDELLIILSKRFESSVRAMDTVFRQGGDEFLILLRGLRNDQDVRRVIHKIFESLQEPVILGNHKIITTTSVGVAYCKYPQMEAEQLIQKAELAMYKAKAAGRSNFRVFTDDMLMQANNRMMIEQDIGRAMADKELDLFLQPIIEISTGKVKGFEALIRWNHPSRGLIMPNDFIPDIETSDAIIDVGNYVIVEGIALLAKLFAQGWSDLYMAINLSSKHYLSPGLIEYIQRELDKHNIPHQSLLLEVTEESVIEQLDEARRVMQELKALGVRIAIDDFGTGYSSLSYLKQLPFDVLKIDRCFTSGILTNSVDSHIISTVIDLAHNLNRIVVAEGVETYEQVDFLSKVECELAQGYLYSKPQHEKVIFETLAKMDTDCVWPVAEPEPHTMQKVGS